MKRCLSNLGAVLSLLLFAAACVLWVRSYRIGTAWGYYAERSLDGMWHDWYFASQGGELQFIAFRQAGPSYDQRGCFHLSDYSWRESPRGETSWRLAGFSYDHFPHMPAREWWTWGVPYWILALLTAATPVAWIAHRRRSGGDSLAHGQPQLDQKPFLLRVKIEPLVDPLAEEGILSFEVLDLLGELALGALGDQKEQRLEEPLHPATILDCEVGHKGPRGF